MSGRKASSCFKMLFRRMQLRRRRFAFIMLTVCGGILLFLHFKADGILNSHGQFPKTRVKYVKHVGNYSSACRLPNLDPFHLSIMEFMKDLGKLQCTGERYSNFKTNLLEVKGEGISSVQYKIIQRPRGDDFKVELSDPIDVENEAIATLKPNGKEANLWSWFTSWLPFQSNSEGTFVGKATVRADFVRVDVGTTWGRGHSEMHMQVSPKEEVFSRPLKPVVIPLDVALIMFDSTSAANFKRKMPNTLEYLTKHLNSVLLQGETIVGDGTTAQLSAMLTGVAEKKQPEARRSEPNSDTVDKWRWIFKDFKQNGYATLYSEDQSRFAAFNYRLHGFKDPPTDHYARPFWLEAENTLNGYCIGGRPSHNISLEYLLSYFRAYKEKPKFSIMILAEITHDNQNALGYVDNDLKSMLQTFEEESFLKNTLLIIFGDHGARFSAHRKTLQGKLEERLPFMSITAPKWFTEKYPDLYNNLIHNSKVLTTPFDVYATLRHILSYPSYPSGITTGQSLFSKIDRENRTCENAGVEEHWCPCLNLEEISTDEPLIKKSAEFVVNSMNDLMFKKSKLQKLCHKLVLKEITSAFRDMPSGKMQFFQKTHRDDECDSCGLTYGRKSVNTLAKDALYQLQLATSPNEGFYEATVKMKNGIPSLAGDISRVDTYKDQPYCVADKYPLLRKYCYCLQQRSR